MPAPKTKVGRYEGYMDPNNEGDLYEVCINDSAGSGLGHEHNFGHDFPMDREELVALRDQINKVLGEQ